MSVTELRGRPVIDPSTARRVGTVADVYMDTEGGRLAALDVRLPDDGGDAAAGERLEQVPADQIRRVGRNAVMLNGRYAPEDSRRAGAGDTRLDLDALVGLEVLGEGGDPVGTLVDAHVDPDTLRVEDYELAVAPVERWLGGGRRIMPKLVVACSRDVMIVRQPEPAEQEPTTEALPTSPDLPSTG